jgi:CBS domain-containing protein
VGGGDDVDYLPEELAEEEKIMAERSAKPKQLGSDSLRVPLKVLPLPKPVTVKATDSIADAVEKMQVGHFGAVLAVHPDGKLAGIFTERDVLFKLAGKGKDWKKETVSSFMTANVESLPFDASLAFALNMMTEGGYRHIPVVDKNGVAVAICSMKDVVRYITGFFEKEVKNLPPRPGLLHPEKPDGG